MKKKEVRWLSRDDVGFSDHYDTWYEEPIKVGGVYVNRKTRTTAGRIDARYGNDLNIFMQRGGLAKITIERQY